MIEENVIRPAGARHEATEEVLRRTIVEAGFTPAVRNAAYRLLAPPGERPVRVRVAAARTAAPSALEGLARFEA